MGKGETAIETDFDCENHFHVKSMYRVSRLLSRQTKPLSIATSCSISSIMQAMKGGWARQTFAVAAKSNDKVERKSAVRLSKKDRRVMVESFIKSYQKLNNGSFPSIHATHKEVGGSYYIVREIVRDIIQENKVLAPPKAVQKEHKMFNSLPGDYPFASPFTEPDVSSALLPNGSHESDYGAATEELILESKKSTDQNVDGNLYIGLNVLAEKPEELVQEDFEVSESLVQGLEDSTEIKLSETVEQEELYVGMVSKISQAVEVETFPLQTSVKLSESEDAINLNNISSETVPDQAVQDFVSPIISAVDQNVVGLNEEVNTTDEDGIKKTPEKSSVISNYSLSSNEGIEADIKGSKAQKVIISHSGDGTGEVERSQGSAANEDVTSSSTLAFKHLNGTSSVSVTESNRQEVSMGKHDAFQLSMVEKDSPIVKLDGQEATKTKDEAVQGSTDHQRDIKPTSGRMNLESWEEVSKKPAHESNPFTGFVKACVTALSKLFSK